MAKQKRNNIGQSLKDTTLGYVFFRVAPITRYAVTLFIDKTCFSLSLSVYCLVFRNLQLRPIFPHFAGFRVNHLKIYIHTDIFLDLHTVSSCFPLQPIQGHGNCTSQIMLLLLTATFFSQLSLLKDFCKQFSDINDLIHTSPIPKS